MSSSTDSPHMYDIATSSMPPQPSHTLDEFKPQVEENRGYAATGRIPVGFWYPTPSMLKLYRWYVENEQDLLDKMKRGIPANRYPAPSESSLAHEKRRLANNLALPMPRAGSNTLTPEQTAQLAAYLDSPSHFRQGYCGSSECRLCGLTNGYQDVDDGVYVWPSGLTHYVVVHNVGLPTEFVAHALAGGRAQVVETMRGFAAVRDGDNVNDRVSGFVGKTPTRLIFPTPEAATARVVECFAPDGPCWDYYVVPVEFTVTNDRVSAARELGPRVLAIPASRP